MSYQIEFIGTDIRVLHRNDAGQVTDIWEGPPRPLLGILVRNLIGPKFAIRKVRK